jgi:hypothetical protein
MAGAANRKRNEGEAEKTIAPGAELVAPGASLLDACVFRSGKSNRAGQRAAGPEVAVDAAILPNGEDGEQDYNTR